MYLALGRLAGPWLSTTSTPPLVTRSFCVSRSRVSDVAVNGSGCSLESFFVWYWVVCEGSLSVVCSRSDPLVLDSEIVCPHHYPLNEEPGQCHGMPAVIVQRSVCCAQTCDHCQMAPAVQYGGQQSMRRPAAVA
jgi:hypothetical protein